MITIMLGVLASSDEKAWRPLCATLSFLVTRLDKKIKNIDPKIYSIGV